MVALSLVALALPAPALAKGEFHPEDEFELHPWISIHIGPLDMSINKAVVVPAARRAAHDPARLVPDALPARQ